MNRRAALLLLLATTGCTGLDRLGPNTYSAGLYNNGDTADYPAGYGPSPGYAGPGTYYAPPAYAPAWQAPGVVYGDGDRTWGHDRHWDHDRDRDRWGEEHRGGTPPDVAQRQRAIVEQEQRYNQQVLQQQQLYNQQVLAAQQRYNQQVVGNPQGTPAFREQLNRELAAHRQQLDQNTSAIKRQELGR